MAQEHRLPAEELERGQELYSAVQAEFDGCVEFLSAGLARRANDDDPAKIERRLATANKALVAFTMWFRDQISPKMIGAAEPLADALVHLRPWLNVLANENDQAIEKVNQRLRQCRLRSWAEISTSR